MTPAVMAFVAQHGSAGKVLEVGSYDVNGSVRNLYSDYTGVDVRPGPGVDQVYKDTIPFDHHTFDKVLYLEAMEHDPFFWRTVREAARVLKRGGLMLVTTRMFGFPKHDHPHDYYRFTAEGLRMILDDAGLRDVKTYEDAGDGGVFGSGVKP